MREKIDEELKMTMTLNRERMKKFKAGHGALLMMSAALLIMEGIFFIVGGLNLYCLIGMAMNIIVFLSGTYGWDRKILHYVLMGINIAAVVIYIIWNPVSALLLRMGIMQHLYPAIQMYIFRRLGKEREELSYELGYPYFSERAFFQKAEAEYTPENDIHASAGDMDEVTESENIPVQTVSSDMEEISLSEISEVKENKTDIPDMESINPGVVSDDSFKSQKVLRNENIYADMYSRKPEFVKEIEYDKELLQKNKIRYRNYKRSPGAVFLADIILALITGSAALEGITSIFSAPMKLFQIFMFIGVAAASIVTVTCADELQTVNAALYSFISSAVFLTLFTFNPVYFAVFMACAAQMLITRIMSKEIIYLKSQFGYPYFSESMIRKQVYSEGYKPEHNINFSGRNMDEIK